MAIRDAIKKKLQNYQVPLNSPDTNLPLKLSKSKTVAVIGGGIAGLSAAAQLGERGFEVTLFEKESFLCGKMGSWKVERDEVTLSVEHGFHAFFRQYHNLRAFMKKLGNFKNLIPIEDYVVLYQNHKTQGFKDLDLTPGLNVLDLKRFGVFNWLTMVSPFSLPLVNLLKFDLKRTFRKFDRESFKSFASRTLMPRTMRLMFNTFARAFFSEPHKMSMAELMRGFHFFFLSNEDGLLYDVLDDDFSLTFEKPWQDFLAKHAVKVRTQTPINAITKTEKAFQVADENFDYVVLATDVKHIKPLISSSPTLQNYPGFCQSIAGLGVSDRYAVLRVWTDRFEADPKWPFFIFTDRFQALDSITFYHKMEKSSIQWSQENGGGIFELHSYALPDSLKTDEDIQVQLLEELFYFFPELRGMTIRHQVFQHRQDFGAFHVGLHAGRPEVETEVPGLYLAGDWVKMENATMLMERSFTSGADAANRILTREGLQENQLVSVPSKGLWA